MLGRFQLKRDYYAGGLMLVLGVGAAVIGSGYKFGTLARMGPGFMPVVLGCVLALMPERRSGMGRVGEAEPEGGKLRGQLSWRGI